MNSTAVLPVVSHRVTIKSLKSQITPLILRKSRREICRIFDVSNLFKYLLNIFIKIPTIRAYTKVLLTDMGTYVYGNGKKK